MNNNFGVRSGAKLMAYADKRRPQFRGIVTLAIVGDPDGRIFVAHGHLPAFAEVHDREARVPEHTRAEIPNPMAVGPPVIKRRSHTLNQNSELSILFVADDPCNPAHLIPLSKSELQSANARPFRGAGSG